MAKSRGNEGFGDSSNLPTEIPEWVEDAVEGELKRREDAERERQVFPWAETERRCLQDFNANWSKWLNSRDVPVSRKYKQPKPWTGHCPGAWYNWPTMFHFVQVRQRVEHDNIHWYPTPYSKSHDDDGTLILNFKSSIDADYSVYQKTRSSPEWNAKKTVLHVRCPSWCPNCGGCGARSTFPGCGRTVPPEKEAEEEQLRTVTEQLRDIRRKIQISAKERARAKAKMEAAEKALKDAEKALKDAEVVATSKKAYVICSKAYYAASEKFDEKAAEYKTLYDENWRLGQGTHFWRNQPPR